MESKRVWKERIAALVAATCARELQKQRASGAQPGALELNHMILKYACTLFYGMFWLS